MGLTQAFVKQLLTPYTEPRVTVQPAEEHGWDGERTYPRVSKAMRVTVQQNMVPVQQNMVPVQQIMVASMQQLRSKR